MTMLLSDGDLTVFVQSPNGVILISIAVLMLVLASLPSLAGNREIMLDQ